MASDLTDDCGIAVLHIDVPLRQRLRARTTLLISKHIGLIGSENSEHFAALSQYALLRPGLATAFHISALLICKAELSWDHKPRVARSEALHRLVSRVSHQRPSGFCPKCTSLRSTKTFLNRCSLDTLVPRPMPACLSALPACCWT